MCLSCEVVGSELSHSPLRIGKSVCRTVKGSVDTHGVGQIRRVALTLTHDLCKRASGEPLSSAGSSAWLCDDLGMG